MNHYTIRKIQPSELSAVDFSRAETGHLNYVFEEASSDNRPDVTFQVLHDGRSLYVHFRVLREQSVRVTHVGYQAHAWKDSCCEFFVQPKEGLGYFNFEMTAGGSLLLTYVEDPYRDPSKNGGMRKCTPVPFDQGGHIEIIHTLPERIEPPLEGMTDWELRYRIPFGVFESFIGPIRPEEKTWHGNFYKCGDETPKPHYIAWAPIPILNFHTPSYFGTITLE